MITLDQYSVKLIRLQEKDIELVRYWRNQADINNFMEFRNYITPTNQIKWFHSINNKLNYYFIIEYENKKIGLINSKNYDSNLGFSEGGIFIWDKHYLNSYVAIYSTLCFLNFIFHHLKISKKSMARILRSNPRAIQYNKQIGYKLLPGQDDVENQLYELSEEDYIRCGGKLNKAAALLNPEHQHLKYYGKVCDENLDDVNDLLRKTF